MILTFYLANAVKIHPTDTSRVDEVCANSLASHSRSNAGAFEIIEVTFRISLIFAKQCVLAR